MRCFCGTFRHMFDFGTSCYFNGPSRCDILVGNFDAGVTLVVLGTLMEHLGAMFWWDILMQF